MMVQRSAIALIEQAVGLANKDKKVNLHIANAEIEDAI